MAGRVGRNVEECDVVVVGARCAGSAAASVLARDGRRVVVLDRVRFPSDTLSTHLLFPQGVSELKRIGALPRILALDPSMSRWLQLEIGDVVVRERWRAVDGLDYCICVPRTEQDAALVETARASGADVRERCDVGGVLWSGGRAAGVWYRDADGTRRDVRAKLVIGADGRRSTIAAAVGTWRPYRASRNGRGLVFRYLDDPLAGTIEAETIRQWRDGTSLAFAFPSAPRGRLLALFMADRNEIPSARRDPDGYWASKLAEHPGQAARLEGATNMTKLRTTGETTAFFRASSGPGWALAGDAGHFKDPVIGQGMRDALWMGRTLAESAGPVLDDAGELDRTTRRWEAARDRECVPAYHFGNFETRVRDVPAVLREAARRFSADEQPSLGDLFGRNRNVQQLLPLPRMALATADALRRGDDGDRRAVLREAIDDLRVELRVRRELRAGCFRSTDTVNGSEHPGWPWPDEPVLREDDAQPAAAAAAEAAAPIAAPVAVAS